MTVLDFLAGNLPAFVFCVLLLGLLVGSFLNVVIYRLPVMMFRDWKVQAREALELPPEPSGETFN
ncbi:prepilin peptidase, partial [Metapseudomonas otitidis]